MSKIVPAPDRENFEKEIAHLFINGDLSDIARLLQKDQSLVSKQFNPYTDEKHNPFHQALLYLWACDAISDTLGAEILNIILRERERWLNRPTKPCHPVELAANVGHQYVEAMECEMREAPADKRAKEWHDVEVAARAKRLAINAEINAEVLGAVA